MFCQVAKPPKIHTEQIKSVQALLVKPNSEICLSVMSQRALMQLPGKGKLSVLLNIWNIKIVSKRLNYIFGVDCKMMDKKLSENFRVDICFLSSSCSLPYSSLSGEKKGEMSTTRQRNGTFKQMPQFLFSALRTN